MDKYSNPYVSVPKDPKPSKCPSCGNWYVPTPGMEMVSCTVYHGPGSCCHYSETQVPEPSGVADKKDSFAEIIDARESLWEYINDPYDRGISEHTARVLLSALDESIERKVHRIRLHEVLDSLEAKHELKSDKLCYKCHKPTEEWGYYPFCPGCTERTVW